LAWYGAPDFDTARTSPNAWWYSVRWTQNVGYGGWQAWPAPLEIPAPVHMQPGLVPEPSYVGFSMLGFLFLVIRSKVNLCGSYLSRGSRL
jgi:hypothetical protein